ncbi:unnamed protein product [Closterium sp. Yama58-4]|nr:unnamed protein product [Closterium sp. Yama58-4]
MLPSIRGARVSVEGGYGGDGMVVVGAAEEALGSAHEVEEDGDAGNATRLADGGKEKGEVGVEATTETGQEEAALEGSGKVKELADQVADSDETAVERLRNATAAMSKTITGNITGSFDEAWKTMKTFAEQASAWLEDFDNPEGRVACARAVAVDALADHVNGVVGEAKRGLELYITTQLSATQVNIATAVTSRLAVQPPLPPQPTPPALPEELLKPFKADIMKAVTEATHQSFVASGLKMLTEMIGTVAPGRRGSSPSANDADHAQRRVADKQAQNRTGGGDDAGSVERSNGADGSRGLGASPSVNDADHAQWREADKQGQKRTGGGDGLGSVKQSKGADGSRGPGGSKPAAQSVVNQLKMKAGWQVLRSSHSKGDGSGGADGGPADGVAAKVAAPEGPPLVAEQTHPQASGGKDVRDKGIPTAQTAKDGGAGTAKGPSVAVARSTSIPPPAAPSAAKGDAKAPAAAKLPTGGDALREMLRRMEAHRRDVQHPPVVDAGPAETARRSVTPQVAGTSSGAPPAAPQVAARPPADSKSAFFRAQLVARKTAAPPVTQPEPGKSATPTSVKAAVHTPGAAVVDVVAEKGVRAALATEGRADRHADIAAIEAHFEAAKRPEHAPALAIMDTAHVQRSATHGGGSAEPTAAVAERIAGRKGKDESGKGKAVFQRSTRAMSAGKEISDEKGKKVGGNQDKKGGKGKSAKQKAKEEEEDEAVGEGKKEHGRRGHGIRHDKSGDGLGWVGEIKVNGENRYIGKSRDKMDLAYKHSIAFVAYGCYVSRVLMDELTVLKNGRGIDDILGRYRGYTGSGDALHDVLLPAIWFPIIDDTEEGKEETEAFMSAMLNRVSMCAAYGKVAAGAAIGKVAASAEGKAKEKTEMEGAEGEAVEKTEMAARR